MSVYVVSGDICQQFTREMFDMYQGFASYKDWDFGVLNYTPAEYGKSYFCLYFYIWNYQWTDIINIISSTCTFFCCENSKYTFFPTLIDCVSVSGGLHHAAVRIDGENVYRYLKHEGGTHRVQRIPEVGLSSRMQRIHTGTMSVIILPQPVEVRLYSCLFIICFFIGLCLSTPLYFCVHSLTSRLIQRIFASTHSDLEVLGAKVLTQQTVQCASFIFPLVRRARTVLATTH